MQGDAGDPGGLDEEALVDVAGDGVDGADPSGAPRPASSRASSGVVDGGQGSIGRLLALLGLTGFAISQPLLAVAGDDPSLFIAAGVEGRGIIAFAIVVALVPPLVLWGVVEVAGRIDRRVGEAAFLVIAGALAGTTAIQWVKTGVGIDARWALVVAGTLGAVGFAAAFTRWSAVGLWTRFTAALPPIAVVLLLVASPAGELTRSRSAAPTATAPAGSEAPASVVFILLDEFPLQTMVTAEGTIDRVRFPNLAGFSDDATWYRDYTAMANVTLQSVPSILSGKKPGGGPATWTSHPDNLFSLLAPTHALRAVEPVTQLCGFSTCAIDRSARPGPGGVPEVLSQMVDVWSDRVSLSPIPAPDLGQFAETAEPLDPSEAMGLGESHEGPAQSPAAVVDFLGALRSHRAEPPSFAYLHLMLPHQPWERYPDGRAFDGVSIIDIGLDAPEVTDWDLALLEQAHTFQARYADSLVGEVLDTLRDNGTYDDTLVVITSDHGIGFTTDRFPDLRGFDEATLDQIAYVPLLIKSPGQVDGRIDDANLTSVDVLPTIAAELGIEVPWAVDGAAAGSAEIAARDGRKPFFDFGGIGSTLRGEVEFASANHRSLGAGSRLGVKIPEEHSLGPLLRPTGADRWLGAPIESLTIEQGTSARATLSGVDALRQGSEARQFGRVAGTVEGLDQDAVVLLVIDGVVQSGSPVLPDGRVAFIIPPEVVARQDLSVAVLHEVGDRFQELVLQE